MSACCLSWPRITALDAQNTLAVTCFCVFPQPASASKVDQAISPIVPSSARSDPPDIPKEEAPVFVRHENGTASVWYDKDGIIRGDSGQQFTVRSSGIAEPGHSLAYGERVEFDIMRGPSGVEAINVKVIPPQSKTAFGAHPKVELKQNAVPLVTEPLREPVPDVISILLPAKVKLSKYELGLISSDAGREATSIKVCLVDRKHDGVVDASLCSSLSSSYVARIRNDLRNNGIILEPLQDALKRLERGASEEELRYIAKVMDAISEEFSRRAR